MPTKSVPAKPNLEFDRKQAKELLVAAYHDCIARRKQIRQARFIAHHPRGLIEKPQLADALLVVAREYGFAVGRNGRCSSKPANLMREAGRDSAKAILLEQSCARPRTAECRLGACLRRCL